MAKGKMKLQKSPSLLALAVLILLLLLNLFQHFKWLKLNNFGVMVVYALIFALPMVLYVKLRGEKGKVLMRLRNFSVKSLGFTIVISLAICMLCAVINVLSLSLFGGTSLPTSMANFSSSEPLVLFITMVVLPAFTEELLVRGILLSEFEEWGSWCAVLFTSLIFALFHGKPDHLITYFVGGLCYGLLTVFTDSVYPALVAHLFNNGAALAVYYKKEYLTYILGDPLFLIFALIIGFVILIAALKMIEKQVELRVRGEKLKYYSKREGFAPHRDICLLLFAAGCIGKMIWSLF